MPALRRNPSLAVAFTALQLLQLFVLPLWLLPRDAAWGWLLCVPVLLTNSWWAFVHEAIHGSLCADTACNRVLGRLHAVCYGAAFDLLRWGHLLHHAMSRGPRDRTEVRPPGASRSGFALAYYFRLLGGLYLYEVLGSLLFLLPRPLLLRAAKRLTAPDNPVAELLDRMRVPATLTAARQDILGAILLYTAAFWLYGPHAWMLLLTLFGRGLLIALMDNVFHYGTPLDDTRFACNFALPGWASALLLHFNLHGTHHLRPGLSCWELPARHRNDGGGYHGSLPGALLRQLRGPIAEAALPARQGG
jgi:fatty acid desaturase